MLNQALPAHFRMPPAGKTGPSLRRLTPVSIWIQTLAAVAFLVIQPVIFFWRVLTQNKSTSPTIWRVFTCRLRRSSPDARASNVSPLWDPFSYCGVPLVGDIQARCSIRSPGL